MQQLNLFHAHLTLHQWVDVILNTREKSHANAFFFIDASLLDDSPPVYILVTIVSITVSNRKFKAFELSQEEEHLLMWKSVLVTTEREYPLILRNSPLTSCFVSETGSEWNSLKSPLLTSPTLSKFKKKHFRITGTLNAALRPVYQPYFTSQA